VKERKKKENTRRILRGSPLSKATSTGAETESLLLLMQYTSGSLFKKYRAPLPYISRGQNRKITE